MKLQMRNANQPAQNLPANDNVMDTGDMGACVSVIILWNKVNGIYQNVRGHHGAGGIEQVNFNGLRQGVPNGTDTLVIVFVGDDNRSPFARETINAAVRAGILNFLPLVRVSLHQMVGSGTVNRAGLVQKTGWQ